VARVLAGRAPPLPDAAAMAADAAASYEALERAGLPVRYTHCQARPRGMSSAHFLLTCALHALPGAPPRSISCAHIMANCALHALPGAPPRGITANFCHTDMG
jgi:hypothetical protein